MKKVLRVAAAVLAVAAVFAAGFFCAGAANLEPGQTHRVYPETAVVVVLDEEEDIVTVQSAGGIRWNFAGCSDYDPGDVVSLLMEENETPEITDDRVLQSRYAGYSRQELVSPLYEQIQTVSGRFYSSVELKDMEGNQGTYYQFRSDDDSVWWLLTAEEIGFVPQILEQPYILTYDNCGTTPENKGCDCPPEYECECELYDDVLLNVSPVVVAVELRPF